LLDLSSFYNAPRFGNWLDDVPDSMPLPLPPGVHNYSGINFDVRGIVQLAVSTVFPNPA
jgi:hypothetical protein